MDKALSRPIKAILGLAAHLCDDQTRWSVGDKAGDESWPAMLNHAMRNDPSVSVGSLRASAAGNGISAGRFYRFIQVVRLDGARSARHGRIAVARRKL